MSKTQTFQDRIIEQSYFKIDYNDSLDEWIVIRKYEPIVPYPTSYIDYNPEIDVNLALPYFNINSTKCICKTKIKYLYLIKNLVNDNHLIVGSECINKLDDRCKLKISFVEYEITEKELRKKSIALFKNMEIQGDKHMDLIKKIFDDSKRKIAIESERNNKILRFTNDEEYFNSFFDECKGKLEDNYYNKMKDLFNESCVAVQSKYAAYNDPELFENMMDNNFIDYDRQIKKIQKDYFREVEKYFEECENEIEEYNEMEKLVNKTTITFGKYCGILYSKLPKSYVIFIYESRNKAYDGCKNAKLMKHMYKKFKK